MKKIGSRRTLLCLLIHALLGAVFILISYLFLNAAFSISYLEGEKQYQLSRYTGSGVDFEDSELFTEIYTKQLQDIIQFCAVRNELEADGTTENNKVDIMKYVSGTDFEGASKHAVVYYVDDLIKWGRQGYTYTRKSFTLDEFMKFYDSDITFDMIRAGVSDGITYISGEDGITEVSVTLLNCSFKTVDGEDDITGLAGDWIEYFKIRDSIIYTSEHFAEYFELYKNGQNLYCNYPVNLNYVIRIGRDTDAITYTNCSTLPYDAEVMSDEALNEIFSDRRNYLIYMPDKLEFLTFSNVKEAELYTFARLYSDELNDDMRLWAFVAEDYELDQDAFARSKKLIESRREEVRTQSLIIICLIICWIAIFIYLTVTAGVSKDGKTYRLWVDSVWIEIYLVAFAVLVMCTKFVFDLSRGGNNSRIMIYGEMAYFSLYVVLGITDSIMAGILFFSLARRIRNKEAGKHSLIVGCVTGIRKLAYRIESSSNVFVSSLIPFNFFVIANYLLIFLMVRSFIIKNYVLLIIFALGLVALDTYAGIRQFRINSDRKHLMDGIKRISEGELDYKIDKSNLLEGDEDFADAVNNIGEGIRQAVSTSMKDEKMKSDLITNVSHDLKTPLTSIINYVDLLRSEKIIQEPAAGYINTLHEKSVRLKQLLEDLIEASRLSSGNIEVNPTSIGINELMHQVVGEYTDKLDENKLTVIYCGDVSSAVYADGRLMWRIMDNLFGNIIKYSLAGTRVYINFEEKEPEIFVSIKNVSAALNTIQGKELTEKFIRGDSSRTTEGSGLGLFIAKNLTELQGGSFEVIADGDLFKVNMSFKKA